MIGAVILKELDKILADEERKEFNLEIISIQQVGISVIKLVRDLNLGPLMLKARIMLSKI